MSKKYHIQTAINKILKNIPSEDVIKKDIQMSSIDIQNINGNIEAIRFFSKQLAVSVWRIEEIAKLAKKSAKELEKQGVDPHIIKKQQERFLSEISKEVFSHQSASVDALVAPGALEVKISKKQGMKKD